MSKEFHTKDYVSDNTVAVPDNRPSFSDLNGKKFGKLNIISWGGMVKIGKAKRNQWWCKCDCGETGYFLTDANSLRKGLTTSCGCNYKDNGKDDMRGNTYLEDRIDPRYRVRGYRGMEHKCTVTCSVCGESSDKYTGYNIRQRGLFCSCKEGSRISTKVDNVTKWLSSYDYTVVDERKINILNFTVDIQCKQCGHKILDIEPYEVRNKCLCTEGVAPEDKASSVYLLRDKNNPTYFKIGKADNPHTRVRQIQKSVEKGGYSHDWFIKGVKWFSSDKVAISVEHLYHKFFKGKELYKYKADRSRGELEFDGAGETFILNKEDFKSFNDLNRTFLDYLEVNKPEILLEHNFNSNINRLFSKDKVTGIFIPSVPYLLSRLGCKDNFTSRKCVTSNSSIEGVIISLSDIKTITREVEVDGVLYCSTEDFYEQHLHFRGEGMTLKLFIDRCKQGKCGDFYESISTARKIEPRQRVEDLNGDLTTYRDLYARYKPLCAYQTMKDKLQSGVPLEDVINYVPKHSYTKIYIYKGKYYSNKDLYDVVGCKLKRRTFNGRIGRGWDIILAAFVPEDNIRPYKTLREDLHSLDYDVYNTIKALL